MTSSMTQQKRYDARILLLNGCLHLILHPAPATADSYNSLTTNLDTLIFIESFRLPGQDFDSAILLRRPFDLAAYFNDFQRAAKQRSELSPGRGFASLG